MKVTYGKTTIIFIHNKNFVAFIEVSCWLRHRGLARCSQNIFKIDTFCNYTLFTNLVLFLLYLFAVGIGLVRPMKAKLPIHTMDQPRMTTLGQHNANKLCYWVIIELNLLSSWSEHLPLWRTSQSENPTNQ
jgi:hypothetical protein